MDQNADSERRGAAILLLVAVFVLAPPLFGWWAGSASSWYLPYLIWGAIIGLIYLLQHLKRRHEL